MRTVLRVEALEGRECPSLVPAPSIPVAEPARVELPPPDYRPLPKPSPIPQWTLDAMESVGERIVYVDGKPTDLPELAWTASIETPNPADGGRVFGDAPAVYYPGIGVVATKGTPVEIVLHEIGHFVNRYNGYRIWSPEFVPVMKAHPLPWVTPAAYAYYHDADEYAAEAWKGDVLEQWVLPADLLPFLLP